MARKRGGSRRDAAQQPRLRNDAYTGMLVIALVTMILGCVLLGLDIAQYRDNEGNFMKPQPVNLPPVTPGGAPAGGGGAPVGGGGAPVGGGGQPMGGGAQP